VPDRPLLFGHDLDWTPWVWLVMAAGVGIIARSCGSSARSHDRGGMPLVDLALLSDRASCAACMRRSFSFSPICRSIW
jgi:hypothetical protein